MMTDEDVERSIANMRDFVTAYSGMALFSTSARVVDYGGVLYNITGSSPDPKIEGKNWKALLLSRGISGNCYAETPEAPIGSTHDKFNVGGHMTPNPDGVVLMGDITYLMPLCKWHNSTSRNEMPFEHSQTRMLELSGFLLGDTLASFAARSEHYTDHTLVFLGENGLSYRNFDSTSDTLAKALGRTRTHPENAFFLFKRIETDEAARYEIEESSL